VLPHLLIVFLSTITCWLFFLFFAAARWQLPPMYLSRCLVTKCQNHWMHPVRFSSQGDCCFYLLHSGWLFVHRLSFHWGWFSLSAMDGSHAQDVFLILFLASWLLILSYAALHFDGNHATQVGWLVDCCCFWFFHRWWLHTCCYKIMFLTVWMFFLSLCARSFPSRWQGSCTTWVECCFVFVKWQPRNTAL